MATAAGLQAAHAAATAQVRARVLAFVNAVWSNSPGFRDDDVDRIVARILPVVQAGMIQVANLTNAYVGRQAALAGLPWARGVDRTDILDYRGTPMGEVYRRPAVQLYTALSKGDPFTEAVAQGLARLQSIATTDLQQAKTRQSQKSMAGSGFGGFIRVLSGAENCELCEIASTQVYSRGDLMPIHPRCDCGIEPVKGQHPSTGESDRIVTNMHGELGPTLGWAGQEFTSEADIAA